MAGPGPSKDKEDVIMPLTAEEEEENEQKLDDKKWDPSFRRRIRQEQREIINDTQRHRDDITLPEELLKRMRGLNNIFVNVVGSREAAIDAEGLRLLSTIGREQVESTHSELINFDPVVFAEKLVTFMGGRRGDVETPTARLNWSRLGVRALRAFRKPPAPSFIYGTLEVHPMRKRERRARQRDRETAGATSQPKELVNFEDEEESTTRDVALVLSCLKKECERHHGQRVNYFRFVVDPNSFAHTVENMFHFSFLIKEGRARMSIGEDGLPYVHLPEDMNPETGQSTKHSKHQAIVSFSMAEWKRATEKFHVTRSLIPQREQ